MVFLYPCNAYVCTGPRLLNANNVSSQKTIIYLLRRIAETFLCVQLWRKKPNTMTMHAVET